MIFVRDKGRMCNNILQYGHVYAWAREHGRSCVSMRFSYKYQYFNICSTPHHNFATYVFAKYAAKCGLLPVATFNSADGNDPEAMRILETNKNVVVEGWNVRFYDLFLKYRSEITELFGFKSHSHDCKSHSHDCKSHCFGDNNGFCGLRLGVHIRRGDYKTWRGGRYYYADSVYADYIRQFVALHKDERVTVYICGNDPRLDHEYYRSQLPGLDINFPEGNPAEDLCLLSECDYLIGAPSTFTLVASMYHDVPLCWMLDADTVLSEDSFKKFDYLFRHIQ